jgi:hypothetical protein
VGLDDYGIDLDTLRRMYAEWRAGATKSHLERTYLNKPESHGKVFTSLVRTHLGIETERRSSLHDERDQLRSEVERLTRLLIAHGVDPTAPSASRSIDSTFEAEEMSDGKG